MSSYIFEDEAESIVPAKEAGVKEAAEDTRTEPCETEFDKQTIVKHSGLYKPNSIVKPRALY